MHLPDVNFWIALTFRSHTHHAVANAWMESVDDDSCGFCRVTQMGFLRLATNQKIFPADAVPMRDAWQLYDQICADLRVGFVDEPEGLQDVWRSQTQSSLYCTNVWTDAYLAAFALAADFAIVTFDMGFAQYKNLKRTILS